KTGPRRVMPDLKEKKCRSAGRARARSDALVHRVNGVPTRRIILGVTEENETIASRSIAGIGNAPAIFRRDAKRQVRYRHLTSIFFRKLQRLKMSQPRSKPAPRRIRFMRWRVFFCRNRSAITSG